MERQDKINKIYEVIANKELSFGLILNNDEGDNVYFKGMTDDGYSFINYTYDNVVMPVYKTTLHQYLKYDIIGHPVMIGDVLDYFELNPYRERIVNFGVIFMLWKEKRKPIDSQSDDLINYIYNLINLGNTKTK